MLSHLFALLRRSIVDLPLSVGTNWLGLFLLSMVAPAIAFVLKVHRVGWRTMLSRWGNVRDSFVAAVIVWSGLFSWSIINRVYMDHMELMNRVKELSARTCWMANLGMKPPTGLPAGMQSGNSVVFWCSVNYEAPLSVQWDFVSIANKIGMPFFPDILPIEARVVTDNQKVVAYIDRPSLLRFQPTILEVFGDGKTGPQARRITIRTMPRNSRPSEITITATDLR